MFLLLPCLSGAGLADERRHRHERHWGSQPPLVRHELHRRHHHHAAPHMGWRVAVGGPWYVQPRPVVVVLPPPPPAGQYWYYCANPMGYYPYVAACAVEWQAVSPGRQAVSPSIAFGASIR